MTIKSTFLGAHTLPASYKSEPDRYVDVVVQEMIPAVAESMMPLMPASLPRNFVMYAGFKKRFRTSMRIKTRHNGIMMLTKTFPEAVGEVIKILVVDCHKDHNHCSLGYLVLKAGFAYGSLLSPFFLCVS